MFAVPKDSQHSSSARARLWGARALCVLLTSGLAVGLALVGARLFFAGAPIGDAWGLLSLYATTAALGGGFAALLRLTSFVETLRESLEMPYGRVLNLPSRDRNNITPRAA